MLFQKIVVFFPTNFGKLQKASATKIVGSVLGFGSLVDWDPSLFSDKVQLLRILALVIWQSSCCIRHVTITSFSC